METNLPKISEQSKTNALRSVFQKKSILKDLINDLTVQDWEDIKKSQNYKCAHCGKPEPEIKLTVDHIVPISFCGPNTKENIQGLCKPCNSRKRNRIDSLGFTLLLQKHEWSVKEEKIKKAKLESAANETGITRVVILLNDGDKDKLKAIAKEKQVSMGVLIRDAIKKILKEGEKNGS